MVKREFIVFVFVLVTVSGYMREKADWIKTCMKKEPEKEFMKCSTSAVRSLFGQISTGIPEIGLGPVDPLILSSITITQSAEGPFSMNCTLTNATVTGFGTAKVLSNWVDPKNYDWVTKVHMDNLRISGKYSVNGRVLLLQLRGGGDCWFDVRDVSIIINSDVDLYQRDEFSFYNVTGVHIKFTFNGLKFYLGNLFNGIKTLEQTTNHYLNQNWRPMAEAMTPVISDTIERIMLHILKQIFDEIPADFWVKDIAEPVD